MSRIEKSGSGAAEEPRVGFHGATVVVDQQQQARHGFSVGQASVSHRVLDDQDHDRAHHGDEQAPHVEATHAAGPDEAEGESADDCAHDSQDDVDEEALTGMIDNLTGDEPGNEAE
jgi:hypothetical protein